MRFFLLSLSILISNYSFSQDYSIDDLNYYADIMTNVEEYKHKERANEALIALVEKVIENKDSDMLKKVKWISSIAPADSSFHIYTWHTQYAKDKFNYNGYIVFEDDSFVKLNDETESLIQDYEYTVADANNWFGQLYYKIMPIEGNDAYLLFGFNGLNNFENVKIAETITFDENNNPSFGSPIFYKEGESERDAKMRIYLQYADDSNVSLNYNPGLKMIMYDHLIVRMGRLAGQGATQISDGSYEGYIWQKDKYIHVEKVFDHIYEEAPVPDPVLDGKGEKDIFGKSGGKQ